MELLFDDYSQISLTLQRSKVFWEIHFAWLYLIDTFYHNAE